MLTALEEYLECYWPTLIRKRKDDSIVIDIDRGVAVIFCTTDGYRIYYHVDIFWKGHYDEDSCIVTDFEGINKVLNSYKYYTDSSSYLERWEALLVEV